MKTLTLFSLTLIFTIPGWTFDVDFGGSIESTSILSTDTALDFQEAGKAILYTSLGFGESRLYVQGNFNVNYTLSSAELTAYPELEQAFFESQIEFGPQSEDSILFSLGRFEFADPTTLILNQALDGIVFANYIGGFNLTAYAGFNGFLDKNQSTMILTNGDVTDSNNEANYFAPPRLIGSISGEARFSNNSWVKGMFLIQRDLREQLLQGVTVIQPGETTQSSINGGLLNNFYLIGDYSTGLGIDSSLRFFGALSLGETMVYESDYQYVPIIGGMLGTEYKYFFPDLPQSYLGLRLLYTTGDSENRETYREGSAFSSSVESSSLFKSLTNSNLGTIFNPSLGNIMSADILFSMKPLADAPLEWQKNLQIVLKNTVFFRTNKGPFSSPGYNTASDSLYLGNETNLALGYRPLSDLGLYLSTGVFLPNSFSGGVFEGQREPLESVTSLYASISF
jgi:hypothetical protein